MPFLRHLNKPSWYLNACKTLTARPWKFNSQSQYVCNSALGLYHSTKQWDGNFYHIKVRDLPFHRIPSISCFISLIDNTKKHVHVHQFYSKVTCKFVMIIMVQISKLCRAVCNLKYWASSSCLDRNSTRGQHQISIPSIRDIEHFMDSHIDR